MQAFGVWAVLSVAVGVAVLLAPVPCHSPDPPPKEVTIRRGILLADENTSANPCSTFYTSVCGNFRAAAPYSGTLRDLGFQNKLNLNLPLVADEADGSGEEYPLVDVELAPTNGSFYAWISTPDSTDYVHATSSQCLPEPLASMVDPKLAFVMLGDDIAGPSCAAIPLASTFSGDPTLYCGNRGTAHFLRNFDTETVRAFVYQVRDFVVDWINASPSPTETKRQAVRRVRSVAVHVGGGEMVPDCSQCNSSTIDTAACLEERWAAIMHLAGQPQRPIWSMGAYEANAYFSPEETAIFIPAGIARPPLFHRSYPFQYNLGGLGSIIAHEFGHSIDLNGGSGFITADRDPFARCVSNGFLDVGQLQNRSNMTVNENIADIVSALSIGPHLDATGFKAFGQVWCKLHPSNSVALDPHSAAKLRVNAVAKMSPHFTRTFDCPPPENVCAL